MQSKIEKHPNKNEKQKTEVPSLLPSSSSTKSTVIILISRPSPTLSSEELRHPYTPHLYLHGCKALPFPVMSTAGRLVFCKRFSSLSRCWSAYNAPKRTTLTDLRKLYAENTPISVATAWDALTGRITEKSAIDITLVGDSFAMVSSGFEDTNELELEEMIFHARAVTRGNSTSFLVADMPFGTFELSDSQAVETAIRLVKEARVQAVKIEGGKDITPTIRRIVGAGVPVMGHVGLTPQKHNTFGGYKVQGGSFERAKEILDDCRALEEAGVFSIVLECVPNKLAELATASVNVPTIGIGAGPSVSGQVLVLADMLGMNDKAPAKFVKQYMNFFDQATAAVAQYKTDVQERAFPDPNEHGYKMKSSVLQEIKAYMEK